MDTDIGLEQDHTSLLPTPLAAPPPVVTIPTQLSESTPTEDQVATEHAGVVSRVPEDEDSQQDPHSDGENSSESTHSLPADQRDHRGFRASSFVPPDSPVSAPAPILPAQPVVIPHGCHGSYPPMEELLRELARAVSSGGVCNVLLDVEPAADPEFRDRVLGIRAWLKVNGDAIYAAEPWDVQQQMEDPCVFYTTRDGIVYAIVVGKWPEDKTLNLRAPQTTSQTKVHMLGLKKDTLLNWSPLSSSVDDFGISIDISSLDPDELPCHHAWVFALAGLSNQYDVVVVTEAEKV